MNTSSGRAIINFNSNKNIQKSIKRTHSTTTQSEFHKSLTTEQ
jgi:hypothetical protein